MRLPELVERFRVGGELIRCPKCGLLVEITEDSKHALGFLINGKFYGLVKASGSSLSNPAYYRAGIPLISVNKLPTHPDCVWTLIPKKIKTEGRRVE